MPAPSYISGNTPDILDSRDLIEWADYNRDDEDLDKEDTETLEAIDALEGAGLEEWHDGATMIREDYFVTYAQEFAEDIGAVGSDAQWPVYCIDWERAANDLQQDYTSVEFLGVTYYVR